MVKKSQEDYLKTMYLLEKQEGDIRVTDIANKMNCSKPNVTKVLNNLKEEELIEYETYGKIKITEKGNDLAKKMLEAHDIVYIFLHELVGVDEENSRKEAEKIETVLDDSTLNKIAKYLHKELGLNNLNCNYNIANEHCRKCVRSQMSIKK